MASFMAGPGAGSMVGRFRTRPRALVSFGVGDRVRGGEVKGSLGLIVFDEEFHGPDQVGSMDPGKPLASVSQAAAQTQAEEGHHFAQGPAAGFEDYAEAHQGGADAVFFGLFGFVFPLGGQVGQEVCPPGLLIHPGFRHREIRNSPRPRR